MLPAGGSCLLSSINLAEFVTENREFDFEDFVNTVKIAVKALNEVLEEGLPLHPLEEQRESVANWRQIGLGIFGLADMLIKMKLTYGSEESLHLCGTIANIMMETAITTSNELAKEYGAYPMFNPEAVLASDFIQKYNVNVEDIAEYGLRNSQLLTIAPTGSLSSMLGVSGGIEPVFANYYTRKTESLHGEDKYYKVYTPVVQAYMEEHDIEDDSDLPSYFITAQNLDYKARIDMQSVWQNHIDASISSTVNVPNEFTVEDVEKLYMYAWEKGLKGITIYRAGCAREGILVEEPKKKEVVEEVKITDKSSVNGADSLPRGYMVDVSDDLVGYKRKLNTGCGSIHFEMYSDELTGEPQETFINIGSSGGCERNYQFISRLISLALRGGVPIEAIIDQAMSIRPCTAYVNRTKSKKDTSKGTSCPSAIGNALKDLYEKTTERFGSLDEEDEFEYESCCEECESCATAASTKVLNPCPECGAELRFEGGCNSCVNCGWSKCDL